MFFKIANCYKTLDLFHLSPAYRVHVQINKDKLTATVTAKRLDAKSGEWHDEIPVLSAGDFAFIARKMREIK